MLRTLAVVLAFAATATATASAGELGAPVVGGSTAPLGKWPDAVAVLGSKGSCTGTLIAPDVVLTAGHCAEIEPSVVIANTTDYTSPDGVRIDVESTTAYPDWQHSYDISVITLAHPVPGVQPRQVGTSCTFAELQAAMSVHLVGFGLTSEAGTGDNTHLNEAMAPVVDPDCTHGHGCNGHVAPGGEFVAGGAGTDSCFGDSGGPVYFDTDRGPILIGAVSRGVDGAAQPCGGGGIYVRTDKVVSWIESTTHRTIAKDDCGLGSDAANVTASSGCAASGRGVGGGSVGGLLALALLAARRRRSASVRGTRGGVR
ncbi:MAG: trypsin-like serine protease [Deltaproteobacteria bacterium]|nr:trypsin-like serine protease [Deltaproteobacteria bacterium]